MGIVCDATKVVGDAVGSVAGAASSSVLGSIAQDMTSAAGSLIKTLSTFWMSVQTPQLDGSGTPVSMIEGDTSWIVTSVAVVCILAAAAQMALRRRGQAATVTAMGLARLVVVSAGATFIVEAAGKLADAFSGELMASAHLGPGWGAVISVGAISGAIGPGSDALMLIIALLVIFSSLIQLMLMILRAGLLVVLTGTLPLAASASMSEWGESWWRKHLGWLTAWLLYKPAAALLFAAAFHLTQGKTSVIEVLSGLMLLVLSVLTLPALLRVIVPATASLGAASGGPLAMAAIGAVATGAIKVAGITATGGASAAAGAGSMGASGAPGPTGTPMAAGGGQTGGGGLAAGGGSSRSSSHLEEIAGSSADSGPGGQAGSRPALGVSQVQEYGGGHGSRADASSGSAVSAGSGSDALPGLAVTSTAPAGVPRGAASGAVDSGGDGSQVNGGI
jgi:hypothetical protein